jgi:acetoin utilization deacetylase AcuC-like enzyme
VTASTVLLVNPEQAGHAAVGHPERPERVESILSAVAASDLGLTPVAATTAEDSLLASVHEEGYVRALDAVGERGGGYLDPDTYMTDASMAAARTACGAVMDGVRRVLRGEAQSAFAAVRPPGHHAERSRAMGFCLLNNLAVGVAAARLEGVRRIAVVDFDVHHGNGTQHTFAGDGDLLYASAHQYPFYPGTGGPQEQGENLVNIPLPAGTADSDFLTAYRERVQSALERFAPELLMVSAGFDAHERDPLAGLKVTTDGYLGLANLLRSWAERFCQGRSVWVLEGGYDLDALAEASLACLRVLQS